MITETGRRIDLLTLEQQKASLRQIDRQYWHGNFAGQIDALDTTSTHQQQLDDLEIFHVQADSCGSTVQTLWWPALTQNRHRWPWWIMTDRGSMRQTTGTVHYPAGIYRVRINLAAVTSDEQSIIDVRREASARGTVLATTEVFSALGLIPDFLRAMYYEDLPTIAVPGIELTTREYMLGGSGMAQADLPRWASCAMLSCSLPPEVRRRRGGRKAIHARFRLNAMNLSGRSGLVAIPTIIG